MPKSSPQTKSFGILLGIAVIGTLLAVILYNNTNQYPSNIQTLTIIDYENYEKQNKNRVVKIAEAIEFVDTSDWPQYVNEDLNLTFKYRPDWKVLTPEEFADYTLIEIDPGRRFYNIKIYVSDVGYAAMKGLPLEPIQVNGVTAQNLNHMLYGLEKNNLYYTFDVGLSLSLTKDFNALVSTVNFLQ